MPNMDVDLQYCQCGGFITAYEGMYELHIKSERHREWLKKMREDLDKNLVEKEAGRGGG